MTKYTKIKGLTASMSFWRNINYFLLVHPFKGSGRLMNLISKIFVSLPKGPTIVHTKHGYDLICMDPVNDKGVEKPLYFTGTYEAGTLSVMKKCLRQGDIFMDVGANIGLMSIFAAKLIGNIGAVYAFEPEPETFKILERNIEINKIDNIHTFNIALGDKKGRSFIYTNPYTGRGSASLIKPTNENKSKKYEIQVQMLDEFLTIYNLTRIRMIKIDVEGWELHVLKGAQSLFQKPDAPIICVEYSKLTRNNEDLLDTYRFVTEVNNYKIYKLQKGKEIPSKLIKVKYVSDLPDHDNLFCFLPEHLRSMPKGLF